MYWVSIGHYEAVAVGNWWYWVSKGHSCLYILHKVEIWTGVTDASLTTLKDSATQLLTKYKSGALLTQLPFHIGILHFQAHPQLYRVSKKSTSLRLMDECHIPSTFWGAVTKRKKSIFFRDTLYISYQMLSYDVHRWRVQEELFALFFFMVSFSASFIRQSDWFSTSK